jgi:hypothetical protein
MGTGKSQRQAQQANAIATQSQAQQLQTQQSAQAQQLQQQGQQEAALDNQLGRAKRANRGQRLLMDTGGAAGVPSKTTVG